ncbi:MAG TPA: Na+/H+ antiporter NhaC [Cyclobacteriaceae bacterium]|nr:Na+/H+ antiporter NhaC [Cyclobacteriaceae bacterium]
MAIKHKSPSLLEALLPILLLVILLIVNLSIFGVDGLSGSNQMVLIISSAIAACMAVFRLGVNWEALQEGIVKSIGSAMPSILILFLIGSLAGTWMLSGIVPAMIYYGLQFLSPVIFLAAACLICGIVSVATGSSWTTVATVGVALLGIGRALGFEEGIIAGAIISGAYFGDKMSPLSDTTNLAPAMAGTDLFTHIRHMTKTTVPSITLTLVIFCIIGFSYEVNETVLQTKEITAVILEQYNINIWLFIVPVVVIAMIIKKVPAVPALFVGAILGGVFAVIFQPQIIQMVADEPGASFGYQSFKAVMMSLYGEVSIITSNAVVNELLITGGMAGMLNTIWLIVAAMAFGGIMEKAGMLTVIAEAVIRQVHSLGSLIASTAATCIFLNMTTSDQYLAILIPGRMYADIYKKKGLKPENLSRTLEDSATVTSVLVPWNTCGATQATVLGVPTLVYFPYCFFNIISPIMTILYGYFKLGINYYTEEEMEEIRKELAV